MAGLGLGGCAGASVQTCPEGSSLGAYASGPLSEPFLGGGNPYEPGSLAVRSFDIAPCDHGVPMPLRIHTPDTPGTYAVIVLSPGLSIDLWCYDGMLRHVASHGFVVVVPQTYTPGDLSVANWITSAGEAADTARLFDWFPGNLAAVAGVDVRADLLGIAGQSHGGKVAWLLAADHPGRVLAVAGVDPNDSLYTVKSDDPSVGTVGARLIVPSLVVGGGLGGVCAFEGKNHATFYEVSPSPAWHVVAPAQGHVDMFDEGCAPIIRQVCARGSDPAGMRRLCAGQLVAFFRATLLGDPDAYRWLEDAAVAPVACVIASK